MKKEETGTTYLPQIKNVARAFLYLEPKRTESSPITVKHPFANTAFVGIHKDGTLIVGNILDNPAELALWRKEVKQFIEKADSVSALISDMTPSYYFGFLKYIKEFLSKEDLGETLSYMWRNSEAPNRDANLKKSQLLAMFKKASPSSIMDEEEQRGLMAMPETVTVFRGVTSINAEDTKALSWTTDLKVAEWFAKRYGETGKVFTGTIPKKYIYAYFTGRGESEVIIDPNMLQGFTIYEENEDAITE